MYYYNLSLGGFKQLRGKRDEFFVVNTQRYCYRYIAFQNDGVVVYFFMFRRNIKVFF